MGMYCLNMLAIAVELARENPAYEDVASKFFEHFVYIAQAMNDLGGEGIELWDEQDGFFYDVLHLPEGDHVQLKVRSMVGLVPLFAVLTLESDVVARMPGFARRMQWFLDNNPNLRRHVETSGDPRSGERRLLSIVSRDRLTRVLRRMLDESEFLAPNGVRSLSRVHLAEPFVIEVGSMQHRVDYDPAESRSGLFGGNSNWRGPIWFPMNYLLVEALQKFHHFYGDAFEVEYPSGSGRSATLGEVATLLSRRLVSLFVRDADGNRAFHGGHPIQQSPHWRDLVLFHEYFNGDSGAGVGASHQTGWTGLVAKLIEQSGA